MSFKLQRILAKQDRLFKGDMNPFDGDGGLKLDGQDVAGTVGGALGATAGAMLGGPWGAVLGSSLGNSLFGGGGLSVNSLFGGGGMGGLFGGGQQPAGGGGGDGGAMMAQAQLGYQAALAQADAAKYTADKQFALGNRQIDAALQQSKQAAMGGILSAAMAANQDTTIRKQLLPHEAGAATIMSHDLAQRWTKTLQMRTAGYQDSAINYELNGKSWKAAFDDPQWNALRMREDTKKDILQNVQLFGIKSDKNPYGIDMPVDEWMNMHSMKKAEDVFKVDPAVAKQRNEAYAKWKQDMYAQGKGMVVDMYENPQLAGSSILTMKGKDALIDPRMKDMLKTMGDTGTAGLDAQMQEELRQLDRMKPEWRNTSANSGPDKGFYFGPNGQMITDTKQGGHTISAKDQYDMAMSKYYDERQSILQRYQGLKSEQGRQKTNWDQAIDALTKGEENPMTGQIKELMKQGVIDKYGMINAGALSKLIPPELLQAPEFKMHNELTPEMKMKLQDDYNKYASMKIDPKLVRIESMGGGVTRKMLLNPDGTRAASMMEGYMTDGMGNQFFTSIAGDRTQDFYDRASRINGLSYSHMSPGYRAPIDQDLMAGGTMKKSNWNYMAKAAAGTKGQPGAAPSPAMASLEKPSGTSGPIRSNPATSTAIKPTKSPTKVQPDGMAALEAGDD